MREIAVSAPTLPVSLKGRLQRYSWQRDMVGESGGAVFRVYATGMPDRYVKHGARHVAQDIIDEMVRLCWLKERLPVPQVEHFVADGEADAWLLMSAIPGKTAYQIMQTEPELRIATTVAIAAFLRRLHALPADECPFNNSHPLRLADAHRRMIDGNVDTDDFGEQHEGWSARQVWAKMQTLLPFVSDPVVTHGDFSLDNILIEGGVVSGCIDLGRMGIADRYQDIAILWDSLGEFGAEVQKAFADAYRIAIDHRKIDFHLCLDEFF